MEQIGRKSVKIEKSRSSCYGPLRGRMAEVWSRLGPLGQREPVLNRKWTT